MFTAYNSDIVYADRNINYAEKDKRYSLPCRHFLNVFIFFKQAAKSAYPPKVEEQTLSFIFLIGYLLKKDGSPPRICSALESRLYVFMPLFQVFFGLLHRRRFFSVRIKINRNIEYVFEKYVIIQESIYLLTA